MLRDNMGIQTHHLLRIVLGHLILAVEGLNLIQMQGFNYSEWFIFDRIRNYVNQVDIFEKKNSQI